MNGERKGKKMYKLYYVNFNFPQEIAEKASLEEVKSAAKSHHESTRKGVLWDESWYDSFDLQKRSRTYKNISYDAYYVIDKVKL